MFTDHVKVSCAIRLMAKRKLFQRACVFKVAVKIYIIEKWCANSPQSALPSLSHWDACRLRCHVCLVVSLVREHTKVSSEGIVSPEIGTNYNNIRCSGTLVWKSIWTISEFAQILWDGRRSVWFLSAIDLIHCSRQLQQYTLNVAS